ncbi:MAG: hypothetical protein IPK50_07045 [Fibrobacterota bacterium]|nr:MAG: hypothetical protein IPK50_07045 [Fibrobacterota bacterium]
MSRSIPFLLIAGFSLACLGCEASKAVGPTTSSPIDTSKAAKDTTKVLTDTTKAPKDTAKTPVVPVQPVLPPKDSIVGPAEGSVNGLPTVTTSALTLITRSTVKSGGEILSEGSSPILHKGIVHSEFPHPIVKSPRMYDSETDCGDGNSSFSVEFQGLKPGTTYYLRSFATNSAGTAYGPEHMFTTVALTYNPGTCSPEINTIDFGHEHNQFYSVLASSRDNIYGDFTLSASAMRVDVDMQFLERPKPGLYTIFRWDGWTIKPTEVYVSGVFGNQSYDAMEGDTVKVEILPNGKISATFCSLHFSSGGSDFDFVTGGNLTEH